MAKPIPKPRGLRNLPRSLHKMIVVLSRTVAGIRPTGWMIYDGAVAMAALALAYARTPRAVGLTAPTSVLIVFALGAIVGGNISGLYDRDTLLNRVKLFVTAGVSTILATVTVALFSNVVLYAQIGRFILMIASATFFLATVAPRLVGYYAARLHNIRVLLVGDGNMTTAVARRLNGQVGHHDLVGFCGDGEATNLGMLGTVENIPQVCRELKVDEIVITNDYLTRADVLDRCFTAVQSGCRVLDEATFHEEVFQEVPVDQINQQWIYAANLGTNSPFGVGLKRGLDILLALLGLTLTLPITLIVWLLIRLTSPGPPIYSQARCGRFGKPFKIYKFRSMYLDAETDGVRWATSHDSRVTPVGRFLRKTRLDEIPQFWNALKGDMSFVGPRPERPELVVEIEKIVPYFGFRHLVRPGITGLAQIRFKYGASIEDARAKLQYDLYYVKNWSLLLDLQIILRTISAMMKGSQ